MSEQDAVDTYDNRNKVRFSNNNKKKLLTGFYKN